ncbi:MAG: atpA [Candidatus Saccharibacteria bacterium]|nr:atpA [Candidatus Saccharibacteria bacterium]
MFENDNFQRLVEADNLTGEVVAVNSFIIEVKGLEGVPLGASVLFEDGQHGFVREVHGDKVTLFNVDTERMELGTLAVMESLQLQIPVGPELIGRVLTPFGEPLDGKGPIKTAKTSGMFNLAPGIMDRSPLNEQLTTGVAAVDSFFPFCLGQRMAILGDSKSGKSTFLSQLAASQSESGQLVVFVLIGKRKADVEKLLRGLRQSGAMDHTIVVMADIFQSLTQSYLAPYAAAAMAESLWVGPEGKNCIIIYDDLSSHAEAYRQLSLLQEVDPGRDSYPGDIFFAHSSLLERGGKLLSNMKSLTPLPVVLTPNDDITAYLSTSIMSITDGQIIFDLGIFRQGKRPAVNAGLSVSRVGGNAQTRRYKRLSGTLFKALARYKQAEEFSHFSSQLSKETKIDLTIGKYINAVLQQPPEELRTLNEQQLMLETVLLSGGEIEIDIKMLKEIIKEAAKGAKEEADFDRIEAELLKKITVAKEEPKVEEVKEGPAAGTDSKADGKKEDKKDEKKDDKKDVKTEEKPTDKPTEAKPEEKPAETKKEEPAHA